jgi:hypothetical protein
MLMPGSGLLRLECVAALNVRSVAKTFLGVDQAAELRLRVFGNRHQELLSL